MIRLRLQTRVSRLMVLVGLMGLLLAVVARREHYRRMGTIFEARSSPASAATPPSPTLTEIREEVVRYDGVIIGLAFVAILVGTVDAGELLRRARLRELARHHAPPPKPAGYRLPDHSDLLESRAFYTTSRARPIRRGQP